MSGKQTLDQCEIHPADQPGELLGQRVERTIVQAKRRPVPERLVAASPPRADRIALRNPTATAPPLRARRPFSPPPAVPGRAQPCPPRRRATGSRHRRNGAERTPRVRP